MHFYILEGVCCSADDSVAAKYLSSLGNRHVFLAKMHTISSQLANQFHMVVDDECGTIVVAELSHFSSCAQEFFSRSILHAQLYPSDASVQNKADAFEVAVSVGVV